MADTPICTRCRTLIRRRGAPSLALGKPISLALPETLETGLLRYGAAHGLTARAKIARRLIELGLQAEMARETPPEVRP